MKICFMLFLAFWTDLIQSDIYAGLFYDKLNFTYAECVVHNSYVYLGRKSTDKNGKNCQIWKNVTNYHSKLLKDYPQFYFAEEYSDHNFCRNLNLNLYQRNKEFNKASAHHFVQTNGWQEGPWCYVKIGENEKKLKLWSGKFETVYRSSPCFQKCNILEHSSGDFVKDKRPEEIPKPYKSYNEILDNFADSLFEKFDDGNLDFYEKRPSDDVLSKTFKKNREYLFFVAMPFMIFSIAFVIGNHFRKKFKKSKTKAKNKKAKTATTETPPSMMPNSTQSKEEPKIETSEIKNE